MFARIVACIDASPTGVHVLEVATEMALRFRCALSLVTVLPWSQRGSDPELERLVPMDEQGRPVHQVLEDGAAKARAAGVPECGIVYLRGTVADAILDHLAASPPDLVVVGTRGLSRGSRLLLGSVSSRLVTEAPCPVLVVRHVRGARRPGAATGSSARAPATEGPTKPGGAAAVK